MKRILFTLGVMIFSSALYAGVTIKSPPLPTSTGNEGYDANRANPVSNASQLPQNSPADGKSYDRDYVDAVSNPKNHDSTKSGIGWSGSPGTPPPGGGGGGPGASLCPTGYSCACGGDVKVRPPDQAMDYQGGGYRILRRGSLGPWYRCP